MLYLLFHDFTLAVAVILFCALVAVGIVKRRSLSATAKLIMLITGGVLALYLGFILFVSSAFGNRHPTGGPTPVMPSASTSSVHSETANK